MNSVYRLLQLSALAVLAGVVPTVTLASVPARIGPYRLQIYTKPAVTRWEGPYPYRRHRCVRKTCGGC